jgi:anti-anti-sigma factor
MRAIVDKSDGKVSIRLDGRFDFSAHRDFRESYSAGLEAADVREFEIDLARVEYVDSSALGMLLMLREKAQAAKKTVALTNCTGPVKQILDVANFGRLFSIR